VLLAAWEPTTSRDALARRLARGQRQRSLRKGLILENIMIPICSRWLRTCSLIALLAPQAVLHAQEPSPPWGDLVDCTVENGFPLPPERYHYCGHYFLQNVEPGDLEKVYMSSANLSRDRVFAAIVEDEAGPGEAYFEVSSDGEEARMLPPVVAGRAPRTMTATPWQARLAATARSLVTAAVQSTYWSMATIRR
jgi:hypothetical protein